MLAQKYFPPAYVEGVRTLVDRRLTAFTALPEGPERDAFAPHLAADLLILVETAFVHRQRGMEAKKDSALKDLRARVEALIELGPAPGRDEAAEVIQASFAEIEARFLEA